MLLTAYTGDRRCVSSGPGSKNSNLYRRSGLGTTHQNRTEGCYGDIDSLRTATRSHRRSSRIWKAKFVKVDGIQVQRVRRPYSDRYDKSNYSVGVTPVKKFKLKT